MREDHYYKKAKDKGYRSRAAYKLKQIANKYKIFERGQLIVDLGSSPGGWSQVASEYVGNSGLVVSIDRSYIPKFRDKNNIKTVLFDIMNDGIISLIKEQYGKVDVVLSDCAPNISGNWDRDQAIQIMLAKRALFIAKRVLDSDGAFVCKVFQGRDFEDFITELRDSFSFNKMYKPKASRKKSAETFAVGKGLK